MTNEKKYDDKQSNYDLRYAGSITIGRDTHPILVSYDWMKNQLDNYRQQRDDRNHQ